MALLVFGLAQPTNAEQGAAPEQVTEQMDGGENKQDPKYKSGYEDIPQFGGPNSVGAQLEEDNEEKVPLLRIPVIDQALKPWFDWKGNLNKNYGLSFGLDYTALGQAVTDSPGENGAAGGIFRFFGNWTVVGRDSGNTGSIVFKVENRHRLGTDIPPREHYLILTNYL